MAYNRIHPFDLGIVNVENEQILQNELSLGRWIVDAITLLLSRGESLNLQQRIEVKRLGFYYIPDIYLEKGCKAIQLTGRTIIDIKSNLLYDTEIRQSEIYKYLIEEGLVDNLIVVYKDSNKSSFFRRNLHEKITLKKAEQLINEIKQAIKEGKGDFVNAYRKQKEEKQTWRFVRKSRMLNAINDYNRYNSVFFLGAGVSASANILNWTNLLRGLFSDHNAICDKEYDKVFKEMDYSNLMMARYIQKSLSLNKTALVEKVRALLYSKHQESSELIDSICRMIKAQEKVMSVITYNYDTLIEDNLNKINKRSFSVYKNNHADGSAFPVYHVHGIVFQDSTSTILENIVLSEEDYHEVYSKVFDWSNVEQLHALTRCTCFFIGLSMKDPNLRRLLEIAKEESGKSVRHYVFLERKSNCKNKEMREKDFQTREDMFADLGLKVIWYRGNNNHKELPILLNQFVNDLDNIEGTNHDKGPC